MRSDPSLKRLEAGYYETELTGVTLSRIKCGDGRWRTTKGLRERIAGSPTVTTWSQWACLARWRDQAGFTGIARSVGAEAERKTKANKPKHRNRAALRSKRMLVTRAPTSLVPSTRPTITLRSSTKTIGG